MVGSPALEESAPLSLGLLKAVKIILLAINYTKVKGMVDYNVADSF